MGTTVQSSWADEIEEGDSNTLPLATETISGNQKITTEYSINDDGKKIKIVRTFERVHKEVPKTVAKRKVLPKFGMSRNDNPGPNPATTVVAEEIYMNFVHNKEEHEKDESEKSVRDLLKEAQSKGVVRCRLCKEDHWTTNCPYKDKIGLLKEIEKPESDDKAAPAAAGGTAVNPAAPAGGPKAYVPPGRRLGPGTGGGESMNDRRRTEDTAAIRVSNLSESTQEADLQELFKPFGHIARIYLSKDKMTGQCKGFAFVHYYKKSDAETAIATLNGYGYDHLILNVEWAKPSNPT